MLTPTSMIFHKQPGGLMRKFIDADDKARSFRQLQHALTNDLTD